MVAGAGLVPQLAAAQYSSLAPTGTGPVTIHAARAIDGLGHELTNAFIVVRDGRIEDVSAGPTTKTATYELGDVTLLPGLIDAHVHPGWYINRDGALHSGRDGDMPAQSALARAGNLYATLTAGFTTIQSVGGVEDLDLRDAVARWQIPGPRVLTSNTQ
jgi:imidazolonepropionase-like amidohydrolase